MTALAGYWSQGRGEARDAVATMLSAQRIYAPDDDGAVAGDSRFACGRRLFATLPEDRFDTGPVVGGGGRFLLVADVRLDARDEIAARCGIVPADAAGLSDAALAMRAIERDGVAAIEQLLGDFALALWDGEREELTLARDFAGMRPLLLHRGEGFVAFSSMPQGLHALSGVVRAPDRDQVRALVAREPESGSRTVFAGIGRVAPGEVVTVTAAGLRRHHYWMPPFAPLPPGDAIAGLRAELDRAVAARLRRTTPGVAAQLSAGLDSASVVATAARAGVPLLALTAAPPPGYQPANAPDHVADEAPGAAELAAHYPAITHIVRRASERSPVAGLDRHFELYQRPIPNICNAVWVEDLAETARTHGERILLSGSAGNLAFSRSAIDRTAELVVSGRLIAAAKVVRALRKNGLRWRTIVAGTARPLLARIRVGRAASGHFRAWRLADHAAAFGWVDRGPFNAGLRAGWGLDLRDPLADRRLVEFCLSVAPSDALAGGHPRGLARLALADRLPAATLAQTRRGWQGTYWHVGFQADRPGAATLIERIATVAGDTIDTAQLNALFEASADADLTTVDAEIRYRGIMLRTIAAGHFLHRATP